MLRKQRALAAAFACACVAASAVPLRAETCLEKVEGMAGAYDLEILPPLPAAGPEIGPGALFGQGAGPGGLDAAERRRITAILTAARSAALRGDEAACRERADAAAALVERASRSRKSRPSNLSPG